MSLSPLSSGQSDFLFHLARSSNGVKLRSSNLAGASASFNSLLGCLVMPRHPQLRCCAVPRSASPIPDVCKRT